MKTNGMFTGFERDASLWEHWPHGLLISGLLMFWELPEHPSIISAMTARLKTKGNDDVEEMEMEKSRAGRWKLLADLKLPLQLLIQFDGKSLK